MDRLDGEVESIQAAFKKLQFRNPGIMRADQKSSGDDASGAALIASLGSMHAKLLRLFIGSVPLMMPPRRRLRYKQDYEAFKLRYTLIFIALSAVQLVVTWSWLDAVASFFALYYYSTVLLREHILVVNGSNIRAWWIAHHYVCVGIGGILLIWPSNAAYREIRPSLLSFFIFIGISPGSSYVCID